MIGGYPLVAHVIALIFIVAMGGISFITLPAEVYFSKTREERRKNIVLFCGFFFIWGLPVIIFIDEIIYHFGIFYILGMILFGFGYFVLKRDQWR